MKQYSTEKIRNLVFLGHGHSGKTTLAEAMLFLAGASDRQGLVADGTTVCDFDSEEKKRCVSVSTAVAPLEWKDTKINIIDTPGMFDFVGEAEEGLAAAGCAVITVSGKSGINVGTEKAWKTVSKKKLPRAFFVTKLAEENTEFYKVHEDLKTNFGTNICPLVLPAGDGVYVDVVNEKAYKYEGGKATETAIPESLGHRLEGAKVSIYEAVAETDDALFEKYFSGESFTHEELVHGLYEGIKSAHIAPIFCGDSRALEGISLFLDSTVEILTTPVDAAVRDGVNSKGEAVTVTADPAGPVAAYVFKTVADQFVGKLSYFKVISGTVRSDMTVTNMTNGEQEKIGKLLMIKGAKQIEVSEITAGDIGAVAKLSSVNTGDTITSGIDVKFPKIEFSKPCLDMAVIAKKKGDEEKIMQGLLKLTEEDLTFKVAQNHETHQMVISGLGEIHLDVIISKLKNKFGVEVELVPAKVPYRETIRKKCKVQGRYKKQTGGHGQFGDVWIEFEPTEGDDLVFEEKVVGGAVPKNFFPAVEKGLRECMVAGPLAGCPVVGIKATLVDGSYHPVDSSEMSFKTAAILAFKEGVNQASPTILEPIGSLSVIVPEAQMGDIMGDITKRRGRVSGMNAAEDNMQQIDAEVPMSEMSDFSVMLRSVTRGRGSFSLEFARYEDAPPAVAQKVIEDYKKSQE